MPCKIFYPHTENISKVPIEDIKCGADFDYRARCMRITHYRSYRYQIRWSYRRVHSVMPGFWIPRSGVFRSKTDSIWGIAKLVAILRQYRTIRILHSGLVSVVSTSPRVLPRTGPITR